MGRTELKPAKGSITTRKRKGRGNASGLGGECGRGHKGQKSRSGHSNVTGFEGGQMPLYRRIPKRRGHGNKVPNKTIYKAINLNIIDELFKEGQTVDPKTLHQKGLIKKTDKIKILGTGELTKKLTVKAHKLSKKAEDKLNKAQAIFESIG